MIIVRICLELWGTSFQKINLSGSDWQLSMVSDWKNQESSWMISRSIIWKRWKTSMKMNKRKSEMSWGLLYWKMISKERSLSPSKDSKKSNAIEVWGTISDCLSEVRSREKMPGLQRNLWADQKWDQSWKNNGKMERLKNGKIKKIPTCFHISIFQCFNFLNIIILLYL
jgi:hypothetical protein